MSLITPGIGLLFWQTLVFLLVLFALSKFAWKPLMAALAEREKTIEDAVLNAETTKAEMIQLKASNENTLVQVRLERDNILKLAHTTSAEIISKAREEAKVKVDQDLNAARQVIATEKAAALAEIKNVVATLSIAIAEKVVKHNLQDEGAQQNLVQQYLQEVSVN